MDTKAYMEKRLTETRKLVDAFNRKHKKGTVYLVVDHNEGSLFATFAIRFRFNDKFVDTTTYDKGSAYIYVTDALYEELQKLAGDIPLSWNNTGSIGWLSFEEVEVK